MMNRPSVIAIALLLAFSAPAQAQLAGTDTAPGSSCAGFPPGATRMTADADQDGKEVTLICDGSIWRAAAEPAADPDRGIQFNSGGALAADSNLIFNDIGNLVLSDGDDATVRIEATAGTFGERNTVIEFSHSNGVGAKIEATRSPLQSDGMFLSLSTQPTGGVLTERMRITKEGMVRIGTGSADAPLDVAGEIKVGNSGLDCGTAQEGALRFISSTDTWKFCNGSTWLPFEHAGLSGPAGCPNTGDLCADGTVFAGYHPITQEHLFIPTADQDGGSGTAWKTSTGTDDIATDSTYDGRANTNQVANSTTFPAFKLCKDLGTGGHSDWYLPSQVELYYLWAIRGTIEAEGNITNFQNAYYSSSTEYGTSAAWGQNFTNGYHLNSSKTNALRVRCVRR